MEKTAFSYRTSWVIPVCAGIIAFALWGCSSSEEIAKDKLTQITRSPAKTIQAEVKAGDYVIRQGDQISISVWGYPEFTTQTVVKESGTITIPLIGDMMVSSITKEEFTNELKKRLTEYVQGEIRLTVTIVSTVAQRVSVLGSVSKQDNYAVASDLSLLEVLSMAGGTTTDSDLHHIMILRAGTSHQPVDVDLSAYIESGNVEGVPVVRPGDTVFVPKKGNVIRDLSDFLRDAIFIFGFFRVFD